MYCEKCGNFLTTEDKFCKKCGQPVEQTAASVETLGVNNQPQASNPFQTVQQSTQPSNFSYTKLSRSNL